MPVGEVLGDPAGRRLGHHSSQRPTRRRDRGHAGDLLRRVDDDQPRAVGLGDPLAGGAPIPTVDRTLLLTGSPASQGSTMAANAATSV
jgi:hypothetical protein